MDLEVFDNKIYYFKDAIKNIDDLFFNIKNIKNTNIEYRSNGDFFGINHILDDYMYEEIKSIFWKCFALYTDKINFDLLLNPYVRMYKPGPGVNPHKDHYFYSEDSETKYPEYTAMIYFNNDYEGGELEFTDLKICLKPLPGSLIIMPGDIVHAVKDILSGNRYMIMSFFVEKKING
jgi:hypothetical protein